MAFYERKLKNWSEIHKYQKPLWLYRGHKCHDWELKTSFDRCCSRESIPLDDRQRLERALIREFQRAYHQYSIHVPPLKAEIEWLSLMQHYGSPTRLLDFSYSIYVAICFAIEAAEDDSAVWAVNGKWALKQSSIAWLAAGKNGNDIDKFCEPLFGEERESIAQRLFFENPTVKLTSPVNPFHLNDRLRIQKGIFLMPGAVEVPFLDNLHAMPGHDSVKNIVKIVIPRKLRREAQRQLLQMNVTRTSLFPGLEGFAQALGGHPPVIEPLNWRKTNGSCRK